ncbi:MAG: hypothetical protein WCW84_11515 [Sulfurimonas sp.]|jgi:hypothetical protein
MNLFKILSSGDGRINEPNVSAFLGFLLDSSESHGLESRFVEKILEKVFYSFSTDGIGPWQKLFLNNNNPISIKNLSKQSGYTITVELEKIVTLSNDKRRDIDIVFKIFSSSNNEKKPLCVRGNATSSGVYVYRK